jgi:hypothetical protein
MPTVCVLNQKKSLGPVQKTSKNGETSILECLGMIFQNHNRNEMNTQSCTGVPVALG